MPYFDFGILFHSCLIEIAFTFFFLSQFVRLFPVFLSEYVSALLSSFFYIYSSISDLNFSSSICYIFIVQIAFFIEWFIQYKKRLKVRVSCLTLFVKTFYHSGDRDKRSSQWLVYHWCNTVSSKYYSNDIMKCVTCYSKDRYTTVRDIAISSNENATHNNM